VINGTSGNLENTTANSLVIKPVRNATTATAMFYNSSTGEITYGGDVPSRTLGSWSVTPGTASYSFTVPNNSSYQLWVRGNIPDGIIVWNATVTMTNNNVPVIGQQFGWYYLAGNQLVLNSMPSQIVGTAGSITTTSPAVTDADVFTFSITNNSGVTQQIDYGWVRIG
jgi:hypothetical protein